MMFMLIIFRIRIINGICPIDKHVNINQGFYFIVSFIMSLYIYLKLNLHEAKVF